MICHKNKKGGAMYDNYIFDLYGTLIDINTDEDKDELWEKMALYYSFNGAMYDSLELKQKYKKYTNKLMEVSGSSGEDEIDLENVFYQLFKKKGVKLKKKAVREAARTFRLLSLNKLEVYPYVTKVLGKLKDDGKKIYLLSNAQACFTNNELVGLGLHDFFDEIYISSDMGVKKPNKQAFKSVIQDNKLDKKKTVMIGNDYATDIEGANRAGIDSVMIKTNIVNKSAKPVKSTYTIETGDIREILKLEKES